MHKMKQQQRGFSQKVQSTLQSQVDLTDQKLKIGDHEDEKNNVHRFKHLQRVIDEAIHGQQSDKAAVRGFHSLMIKSKATGSPSDQPKVLESISDRFERIT